MLILKNNAVSIFASQKSDGNMLFIKNAEEKINTSAKNNRQDFFRKNKIDPSRLVNLSSIHGNKIYKIKRGDLGKGSLNPKTRIKDTDGLVGDIKNSYLMVTGADCFPIFFYDPKNKAVGIAHAGWRGILKEVGPKTILKLKQSFNSAPQDIKAWIGPGIRKCHFEVGKDVVKLFKRNYGSYTEEKDGRHYINLPSIINSQLIKSGIKKTNIKNFKQCTYCEKNLFSSRRDKFKLLKANAFIIKLK